MAVPSRDPDVKPPETPADDEAAGGLPAVKPRKQNPSGGSRREEGDGEPTHLNVVHLREFANTESARRLSRLADDEIIRRLGLQGFDKSTDDWAVLAGALIEYGYGVFVGWGIGGLLHQKAAAQGRTGVRGLSKIPDDLRLLPDDAHALAVEVLLVSVETFRTKTLMGPPDRRWNSASGASLMTFFIGRCLMELPDVYKRWARTNERAAAEINRFNELDGIDAHHVVDPEHLAVVAVELEEALAATGPAAEAMLKLQAAGYTRREIAELLTTPERVLDEDAIRTDLYRARQRAVGDTP